MYTITHILLYDLLVHGDVGAVVVVTMMSLSRSSNNNGNGNARDGGSAAASPVESLPLELVLIHEVTVDSHPALLAVSIDRNVDHDNRAVVDAAVLCQVATASAFFTGKVTLIELKNIEPQQQQDDDGAAWARASTNNNVISGADDGLRQMILALPIPVQSLLQLLQRACASASTSSSQSEQLTLGLVKTTPTTSDTDTNTTNAGNVLRVSIKQRMPLGIVRTLFHTTLTQVNDNVQSSSSSSSSSSLLQLSLRMLQRQNTLSRQLQTWQSRYTELELAKNEWQATAEQLEGEWDKEKTQLLQNFCDLYTEKQNDSRMRCQQMEQKIHALELALEQARSAADSVPQQHHPQLSSSSGARASRGRGTAATLPESLLNVPGDVDQEMLFDPELVQCLAEGRRFVPGTKNKVSSHLAPQPQRKRRNQTLGTMEYFDVDAALEDVEGDDDDDNNSSSADNDKSSSQPKKAPFARKSAAPPAAKKAKFTAKAPPSNNNDKDDSSTASDSSIFDAKMHGDILSQLAKL